MTGPVGPVLLRFPFTGRWMARNSPADRVPSHGSDLLGTSHAIDLLAVDDHGRSAPRGWRSFFATEPPERFLAFGRPILAPLSGTVVITHDAEPDHSARRSQITLIPYALGQARRARQGVNTLAGNHVVIAASASGPYVLLAHLRRDSVIAAAGDTVTPGQPIGVCGNSGNSTEPHVHVQVTDSVAWSTARGLPLAFIDRLGPGTDPDGWLPRNGEAFEVS
jgi:murein DD-endopeptidase MepM/ murein hydrolase activator NlpD